jgi:hypothetical protein
MGAGYHGKKAMASGRRTGQDHFHYRAVWRERFMWWPKRCELTGRLLWLKTAMMGVAMYTGPGDPVFEFRWHDAKEHMMFLLKGNSNENVL